MRFRIVTGVFLFLALLSPAFGAVPGTFSLNAQIFAEGAACGTDGHLLCGQSVSDALIKVSIYDDAAAGTLIWSEQQTIDITSGYLSLTLGAINTTLVEKLSQATTDGKSLYLAVELPSGVLPTRLPIASVPYALVCRQAGNAATLGDKSPDYYAPATASFTKAESDDRYLGITAQAEDAKKLGGQLPAYYSTSTHTHDAAYLGKTAQAADSAKLEGHAAGYFATKSEHDTLSGNLGSLSGDLAANYYTKTQSDQNFALQTALAAALKRLDDLENKWCPPYYEKIADASISATGYYCKRGADEMVKVGDFWVDRYENSLWTKADCTGDQKGINDGDMHTYGFVRNGTDISANLYACSVSRVAAARYITWFQAAQACGNVGKNLCSNTEWQMASSGTPDPGSWPDTDSSDGCIGNAPATQCNTCSNGPGTAGSFVACVSRWGAYDMIGNFWEWTKDWGLYGGAGSPDGSQTATEFNADGFWNVEKAEASGTYDGTGNKAVFPAATRRGGSWNDGIKAGVFALYLSHAPSVWEYNTGFRCCRH